MRVKLSTSKSVKLPIGGMRTKLSDRPRVRLSGIPAGGGGGGIPANVVLYDDGTPVFYDDATYLMYE